jgi:hypothetical protein
MMIVGNVTLYYKRKEFKHPITNEIILVRGRIYVGPIFAAGKKLSDATVTKINTPVSRRSALYP